MPAWGGALPANDVWKLVAFVQSLGGTVAVQDYARARQGDQPGEQVAPEAQADAQVDSPPPVLDQPTITPEQSSTPEGAKPQTQSPARKSSKPPR